MALFYNKKIFDKYGLTVPTTWDEYVADAKKLHAANPKEYITNDTGDAGFVTSMIWARRRRAVHGQRHQERHDQPAGRRARKKFADPLEPADHQGPAVADPSLDRPVVHGLGNGTHRQPGDRRLDAGVDLESGVAAGIRRLAGRADCRTGRRARPPPRRTAAARTSVMKQSKNPLAAAGFLQCMNTRPGRARSSPTRAASRPPTPCSTRPAFLDQAPAYFGGQKINQVLVAGGRPGPARLVLPAVPGLRQQHLPGHGRPGLRRQVQTSTPACRPGSSSSASYGNPAGIQRQQLVDPRHPLDFGGRPGFRPATAARGPCARERQPQQPSRMSGARRPPRARASSSSATRLPARRRAVPDPVRRPALLPGPPRAVGRPDREGPPDGPEHDRDVRRLERARAPAGRVRLAGGLDLGALPRPGRGRRDVRDRAPRTVHLRRVEQRRPARAGSSGGRGHRRPPQRADVHGRGRRGYLEQLAPIVAPRQIDQGGPIILVQVENEYGAYGDDQDYLTRARRS